MIEKYIINFILIIGLVTSTQAQPGFNKIYNFYPGIDEFNQTFVDNDKIFCIGVAYDTIDWPSPLKIMIVKMDTFGNVLQSKLLKDSLNDFFSMDFLWGDVTKTSNAYYAFAAFAISRGANVMIQIDSNLTVKSIFETILPDSQTGFDEAIVELHDGGFFIAGFIQRPNFKQDGFIRRIDKDGNLLWFKYYGNYFVSDGFKTMIKVNDNRFLLGGFTIQGGSLWEVDSNGVVVNQKIVELPFPYLSSVTSLIKSSSGNGFIGCGATDVGLGQWGPKVQSSIMKFDDALNLEWFKFVGPSFSQYNIFTDLAPTPEGNYVAAGERTWYDLTQPSDDWGGWLFKFSEQGDSLWSRADNAPLPYDASGEFVYGGVGVLPSGSIIGVGKGEVDNQPVGVVVKVSANGCLDTVFCQTTPVRAPISGKPTEVRVYPNPASEQLYFQLGSAYSGAKKLMLRNIFGQLVWEYPVTGNPCSIPVRELPNGIYYWELAGAQGKRGSGKVVVQH